MKSENKRLSINLIANVVSYSTTILISFILTPYLVRTLGKDTYSFYPLANNFVNYMGIVTVALNSMASRFITIEISKKNMQQANVYFSSVFFSNVIMSLVLLVPMIIIVVFLNSFLNIPIGIVFSVKLLFSLTFISMIVSVLTSVFGVAVFAVNRLEYKSALDIGIGILRVLLYVVLFYFFKPNLAFVGLVGLILAIITFMVQVLYTRKLLPEIKVSTQYFNWKFVKEVLFSGMWNSVYQLGGILLGSLGILLSNMMIDANASGDYSIAQTVPGFINGIIGMLTSVFLPQITIKYATGSKEDVINEVKKSQKIMGLVTNVPIVVFIAVSVNFFTLWTPNVDAHTLRNLSMLLIAQHLFVGVLWPVNNLNTVLNKVRTPALVMLATGVLNIISIYIVTKFFDFGIYGIAITQAVLCILFFGGFSGSYQAKCLGVKWYTFHGAVIKTLIGAAIIFSVTYMLNSWINPDNWIKLFLECAVCGVFGVFVNAIIIFKPSGLKNGILMLFSTLKKR